MKKKLLALLTAGILMVVMLGSANATIFELSAGSSFFDSSTQTYQNLTGSITTEFIDFSSHPAYAVNNWTYVRQNIIAMNINGATVNFTESVWPWGHGGGVIDITDQGNPLSVCQVSLVLQDGTTFIPQWPAVTNFAGSIYAPTSFSLINLAPRNYNSNPYYSGNQLDIDADDRLTLYLNAAGSNPGTAPVPEPGTIALLGLGMAGLAVYGKRRQQLVK